MPLTTNAIKLEKTDFSGPFRVLLSGSSGAGKTHFAEKLIESRRFDTPIDYIYYFHPCYLEETPVKWHETMAIPVSYQTGLPTLEQIVNMPPNSVIVLDDLMDKCTLSDTVDQLFRVISGKLKISVMIMTQNYFAQGRFGRNIRNSCNYIVLLRNCCDASINRRAARAMGLMKPFDLAVRDCKDEEYPYMFIDRTQRSQVSGYQVYTNIFDHYMKVYSDSGMPSYIIPEKDFLGVFKILETKKRIVLAQEKDANEIDENAQERSRKTTEVRKEVSQASTIVLPEPSTKADSQSKSAQPYSRRHRKRPRRLV